MALLFPPAWHVFAVVFVVGVDAFVSVLPQHCCSCIGIVVVDTALFVAMLTLLPPHW